MANASPQFDSNDIKLALAVKTAAMAYRGYNVTNLGRSGELLAHAAYGPIVRAALDDASQIAREFTGRAVNLAARVERGEETTLETYHEAIALIIAMEAAQVRLLHEFHGVDHRQARFAYGYSLGEIGALMTAGVIDMRSALCVPLAVADDCVELAHNTTLAILFSRGKELPAVAMQRLCLSINREGAGVIGISSYLAPNSVLLIGQGDTIDRFKARMGELSTNGSNGLHLRKNPHQWPPLHTPIVWQRNIPNRAATMMHTLELDFQEPRMPVFSLVTGKADYHDYTARDLLHQWVDRPQRLWDAVYETCAQGIETVIHVGPVPNIIPATFRRLADNVNLQLKANIGMRALSGIVARPWIGKMLPSRAALLRAPQIRHVILEDWLLANEPSGE